MRMQHVQWGNKLLALVMVVSVFLTLAVQAGPVDTFEFKDEATELRFQILSKELRCPKCQNQNLSDSNSPIAEDLRSKLYTLLQEGQSDQEIIDYMVYRYGDFVLYRPRVNSSTYILWFTPLILIGGVIGGITIILRKRSNKKENATTEELSQEELANLDEILKDK
jgi:cytochrome c-type biogenesis protein CcmH